MLASFSKTFLALVMILPWAGVAHGQAGVDAAYDLVYQIKTAVNAKAPKASYGSAFVVDRSGLLATNFHVVTAAMHAPEKYRIYLVDGDESYEAKVVNIDVVNDLALIKVERGFPDAVPLAKAMPARGAHIFSIGLPADLNKSIIEGNFNGVRQEGPYRKLQMSIPLNGGMSGGPTVNERGEVVGVNVSILLFAQNLAFAVPVDTLRTLIAQPARELLKGKDKKAFEVEIARQLHAVQNELAADIRQAQSEPLDLAGWRIARPAKTLRCWRTDEDGVRGFWTQLSESCLLGNAAVIDEESYAGTMRLNHIVMQNRQLGPWQFFNVRRDEYLAWDHRMDGGSDERLYTQADCQDLDLVNAHSVPLRVNVCMQAHVKFAGLYDLGFRLMSLAQTPTALVASGSFVGFTLPNLTELLAREIDSIQNSSKR